MGAILMPILSFQTASCRLKRCCIVTKIQYRCRFQYRRNNRMLVTNFKISQFYTACSLDQSTFSFSNSVNGQFNRRHNTDDEIKGSKEDYPPAHVIGPEDQWLALHRSNQSAGLAETDLISGTVTGSIPGRHPYPPNRSAYSRVPTGQCRAEKSRPWTTIFCMLNQAPQVYKE